MIPLPDKKYNIIYADPPWDVKAGPDWNTSGKSRDLVYPTMNINEIREMRVKDISASNAWLFLWVINKYIPESYEIAKVWGFKPSCLLTWAKPKHGLGLGGTFVQTTEHLLFCRRGTYTAKHRIDTTMFEYPRRKHSVKPYEIRNMISSIAPDNSNKIELFARNIYDGWDAWGNEISNNEDTPKLHTS